MNKRLAIISFLVVFVESQLPPPSKPSEEQCSNFELAERFDCWPNPNPNQENCESRGCCWNVVDGAAGIGTKGVPFCYYPKQYGGYNFVNGSSSDFGQTVFLSRTFQSTYPRDVQLVRIDVEYQTNDRVRVKISDAENARFEAPYPKISQTSTTKAADNPNYNVAIESNRFPFVVSRKDGTVIFNAANLGAFIFADQFLQISAGFNGDIYGIGEHRSTFALDTEWTLFTLWTGDSPPAVDVNLYGSHPFYMVVESDGRSHGVFLHNSNGMDILLQPLKAITYKAIGGILDFYFFLGPTPADVVKQYLDVIGKPFFPPYWGLGFQLCRFGYDSADNTRAVWQRNRDAGLPFDVQWNDIDYMTNNNDFTVDQDRYGNLPELINDIHNAGMHYVPIVDPGVSAAEPSGTYPPFDDGIAMDIFVKDKDGNTFIGKVWNPVSTAFPDFTHPRAVEYWGKQFREFYEKIKFDAIWIDMNEPANNPLGDCPDDELEHPPYVPHVVKGDLYGGSLCMTCKQYAGVHYNVHNLYAISEADVTKQVLDDLLGKRSFIISRSTFAGSGTYTGHWSGDNFSAWDNLKASIAALLQFNIFGLPYSGADICGFLWDTNHNLCNRWMQLGAFYPFSRNHNVAGAMDQDPAALGDDIVDSSKKALNVRYTLLPYLYTLMYKAHVDGETVFRSLMFEFPQDERARRIDTAFLWGSGIYVIPVLEDNANSVTNYLPPGRWYDWYTGEERNSNGEDVTLDAPFDKIPVLIRGGNVLPTQAPAVTTTLSRKNGFTFIVALDGNNAASGSLFWDDGESQDSVTANKHGLLEFVVSDNKLTSKVQRWNTPDTPQLESIKLLGVTFNVNEVTVNRQPATMTYEPNNVIMIKDLQIPLNTDIEVQWQ